MSKCTWKKIDGGYICTTTKCTHMKNGMCELGKVSLSCDDTDCIYNIKRAPGIYGCKFMDLHLDADGMCLRKKET